ncbi:hypothetical protein [Desulfatiglans anilini]|uniref:hypothetical protein n=1 Tax=Desulfatiglans anilini TaxID=90728 RepID=UPI0003F8123F|nr:hypothetical protein [Desulfatiglans anilini]
MANIKEIKRLHGGDLQLAAQSNVQMDAGIGQKDHFRMESMRASSPRQRIKAESAVAGDC